MQGGESTQSVVSTEAAPGTSAWLVPAAVIASVASCVASGFLSYAMAAAALGRHPLLWVGGLASGPGNLALAVGGVLLAGAVFGIVCGGIALAERRHRRIAALLAILLGVASLLLAGGAVAYAAYDLWTGSPHPADARLIDTFSQHRAQFDEAVAAFTADGSVDPNLLHSIGVPAENVFSEDGVVYFDASVYGLATGGSSKGYAYSRDPLPTTPEAELENADTGLSERGVAYRHISGPWYLFYEWD